MMLSSITSAEDMKALEESHDLILGCLSTWLDNVKAINKKIGNEAELTQALDEVVTEAPTAIDDMNAAAADFGTVTPLLRTPLSKNEQLMADIEEVVDDDTEEYWLMSGDLARAQSSQIRSRRWG